MAKRFRFSAGTIVCLVLAAGLAGATAYLVPEYRRERREFDAAADAIRLRMSCDLSRAGEYRGTLHETYNRAHGASFYLRFSQPVRSEWEAERLLDGFTGHFVLKDSRGEIVTESDLPQERPVPASSPSTSRPAEPNVDGAAVDELVLIYAYPHEKGDYQFALTVKTPAPALAGVSQEVIGRYGLCGMEGLVAAILGFLTLTCGVAAMVFAMATFLLARRAAKRAAGVVSDRVAC